MVISIFTKTQIEEITKIIRKVFVDVYIILSALFVSPTLFALLASSILSISIALSIALLFTLFALLLAKKKKQKIKARVKAPTKVEDIQVILVMVDKRIKTGCAKRAIRML